MGKKYKLPPLVFFEAHSDDSVTTFIANNLPYFLKVGYRAVCFEVEAGQSLQKTMKMFQIALSKAIENINSGSINDEQYEYRLSQLRSVSGKQLFFLHIKDSSLKFIGLDIPLKELIKSKNLNSIERNEVITSNIMQAAEEFDGGIISIIGFGHCIVQQMVQEKDKENANQYLWYHLYSPFNTSKVRKQLVEQYELGGYNKYFPLGVSIFDVSDQELLSHLKRALSKQCYTYNSESLNSSTLQILQQVTGEEFSAHFRTDGEMYVDAILPVEKAAVQHQLPTQIFLQNLSQTLKGLSYEVQELGSTAKEKKSYVIIRGINTQEVAESITIMKKPKASFIKGC